MTYAKLSFIVLLSLVLSGTALAQVESAATDDANAPDAAANAASGKSQVKTGAVSLEQYEASEMSQEVELIQKQKSTVRREQISKLEQLLREHPYYENKADVYYRLAEAYWEESRYQNLVAMKDYDAKSDQFEKGVLKEAPPLPKEDYSTSLEYYRRILREFPEYMRLDEVLYYLGKGAMQQGKSSKDRQLMKEGENTLKRLVQSYPESDLIPKAYLALAEYYFEGNSLFYAKINYEKIITNYKTSAMYNYALYKLAWVYYNLRELEKAIDTFKQVVEEVSVGGESGAIQFREQALNDMIVVFSEMEEPDAWEKARDYFVTVLPEKDAYKKLIRLADLIQAADKHEVAIAMYRHFIEKEPNGEPVPEYHSRIYDSLRALNDMPDIENYIRELFKFYDPEQPWMLANKDNAEPKDQADKLLQNALLWVSNDQHQKAEKADGLKRADEAKALYAKAAEWYRMYAERFPEGEKAYIVNFYYAEILYDQLGDYENAAIQYQKVIERQKKGEFVEDAALGVIYCREKQLVAAGLLEAGSSKEGGIELKKEKIKAVTDFEEKIEVTPVDPREKQYIDAADQYVTIMTDFLKDQELRKKFPEKGKKIPEIMFIAAQTFYRHGMFKDAVSRLQTIFDYDPKHKYASLSVFTLVDCYIRLHRWEKVEEWTRRLIAEKNFTVKSKAELEKYVAISMTEQTKDMVLERKYSDSEGKMKAILKEFGKDPVLAAKITFNLAAVYERAGKLKPAVDTYLSVVKKYPKSDSAPLAMFVIGQLYENQTQYETACEYFLKMEQFKDDPNAPDALRNAALIYEALNKPDDAINAWRKYVKLFADKKEKVTDIPLVELHIAQVLEEKGDSKKAMDEYAAYTKKYGRGPQVVEAASRRGMLLMKEDKTKNKAQILASFKEAMDKYGTLRPDEISSESTFFAAQAAFMTTEYKFDEFQAIKLDCKSNYELKNRLKKKADLHQELEKTYEKILDYQALQWNAACLFRIGLIYYDFARMLLDAPVPEVLDEDQADEYRLTLEQFAGPIEEKSLASLEYALRLAHEKGTYNEWSKLSAEYAAKVNPDTYPLSKEDIVKVDKVKDSLLSTNIIRTLQREDVTVNLLEIAGEKKAKGDKKLDFEIDADKAEKKTEAK
jgi:TolA-binding protein